MKDSRIVKFYETYLYKSIPLPFQVPIDAPEMALKMIDMITESTSKIFPSEKDTAEVGNSPASVRAKSKSSQAAGRTNTKKAAPRKAKRAGKSETQPRDTPNTARAKVVAAHPNPATPTGKRLSKVVPIAKALH